MRWYRYLVHNHPPPPPLSQLLQTAVLLQPLLQPNYGLISTDQSCYHQDWRLQSRGWTCSNDWLSWASLFEMKCFNITESECFGTFCPRYSERGHCPIICSAAVTQTGSDDRMKSLQIRILLPTSSHKQPFELLCIIWWEIKQYFTFACVVCHRTFRSRDYPRHLRILIYWVNLSISS